MERHSVEAFIAKQKTWFHHEESLIIAQSPWGIKWLHPLKGEFATGNWGSGPLPSLVLRRFSPIFVLFNY
jgi:hypothetical protein